MNNNIIEVKDKKFAISIPENKILAEVKRVASQINHDFQGQHPIFLAVLNGSFIFAADLLREVDLPCEISFVRLASYEGMGTTGEIREIMGLNVDVTGRPVIVVEDIVDTGLTMAHMLETLKRHNPSSISICTLLLKPGKLQVNLDIRYCCMQIPNDFIVGYGLDYDGFGRNTRDIYTLVEDKQRNMKNIIIFGAPGSGKGTYSDAIVEKYGMNHISTGDTLRNEIKNGTEVGRVAKGLIDKGQLIPDDLMIQILAKTYDSLPQGRGVIFDGFPRTIPQAEALKQMLAERGHDMGIAIDLVVEEDVLMERLLRRAQIEGRADDNEATIKQRFEVYHSKTEPILKWFEKEGMLNVVRWADTPNKEAMIESIFQLIDAKNA